MSPLGLNFGDGDDGFGKILWGFLRQVVPDAAGDRPVRVLPGELLGIGTRIRVRGAVGITFQGNRRHGNNRTFGKPIFQLVVFRLAFGQTETPAIIVDHDADVIRVIERGRGAIERGVVEFPLRRSELPNEPRKIVTVFVVAGPPPSGGKIILIPPLQLSIWRQGYFTGFLFVSSINNTT